MRAFNQEKALVGEGLSKGLFRDCEIFANFCLTFVCSSSHQGIKGKLIDICRLAAGGRVQGGH